MTELDNRLDFYTAIQKYAGSLGENDAIFVLSCNHKEGDVFSLLKGDVDILSSLFCKDGFVYQETNDENDVKLKTATMKAVFDICFTMLMDNEGLMDLFQESIKSLKEDSLKTQGFIE